MDEFQQYFVNLQNTLRNLIQWIGIHRARSILYFIAILAALQYLSLPNNSLQALRKENPGRTALMKQRLIEGNEKLFSIKQIWVPLVRVSPHLQHAVIVAEDGTFYEHSGVDWYELEESLEKNIEKGKSVRGGSTISQQLSKNLFLSTSKDPLRKLKELIITLRMERTLSKRRILEIYLNIIEWGPGVFGIEAAARRYFGKSASALSREEAIRLAAVIPSPLRHQPNQSTRYVVRRSEIINQRMIARGY
jgi:monofunctional biosynthetic peptidoglycan transglycosylase